VTLNKKITVGILAHVDAGKTTLSEALLYLSGKIRSLGRVDHKNTYLDTNAVERERGITVFSKQARFTVRNTDFILLDTPGHVDFSAETERTLALLDYAILVISAPDGVQNHTRTLWQLLRHYGVPTFIFVNKTDICFKLKEEIEEELSRGLSSGCVAFQELGTKAELDEKLAMLNEDFLDSFLSGEEISDGDIAREIAERRLFPCFFGSALKTEGVEFFLNALDRLTLSPEYPSESFGAKVYKILHSGGTRLTYMKITSGKLTARDEISYISSDGEKFSEKINGIRLYSGDKFEQTDSASAGEICAVMGLSASYAGQGLGSEVDTSRPLLEPVLSYRVVLPPECDPVVYFTKLKELEEEEPSLHLLWNSELKQIEARLMGDIQTELLLRLIKDRFSIECTLDAGKILYKEKIAGKAIGVGHFEPLRHYAEVQLLLEPQPEGTGLVFDTRVPENTLSINWQRLILSYLYGKKHRGVLTGSLLTDTKITLLAGKDHLKHTESGDFREATFRAVRQGLMRGGCILLEPYYSFRLDIPSGYVGRAMSDLQNKSAEFEIESASEDRTVISGTAPVSELHGYVRDVISYTGGKGSLSLVNGGYKPCHNSDEVISEFGYDPEADLVNTPHSVFCAHGAGFVVPWNEVDDYKHLTVEEEKASATDAVIPRVEKIARRYDITDKEVEAIMQRTFGPIKRRQYSEPKINSADKSEKRRPKKLREPRNLTIIDGYNLIYSWDTLKEIADVELEGARNALMDMLSSYAAYTKTEIVLVFDAYLVKDGVGSDFIRDGYRVVFTKEDETADAYIEKMMHELGPDYTVKVVTGDRMLQYSAVLSGILRITAKEFADELIAVGNEITAFIRKLSESK